MDLYEITKLLNEASRYWTSPAELETLGPSARPDEYVEFETGAVDAALEAAKKFPGSEFEFWKLMADAFHEFNERLRSVDAPELRLISFSAFFTMARGGAALAEHVDA